MHDVIIIGGGVAAFTSALFSARRGMKVLVIAKDIGGQANWTDEIQNFPSHEAIGGHELIQSIRDQAEKWGIELLMAEVEKVKQIDSGVVGRLTGERVGSLAEVRRYPSRGNGPALRIDALTFCRQ